MASTPANTTEVIQLTVPSHFPIKLTPSNFSVWRRQVQSTLIGFNLLGFIDGSVKEPAAFNDSAHTIANSAHLVWYRQDQIIINALLVSCCDTIQPLIISTAKIANDAWQRLLVSYASATRGRIISLKAKLRKNPRGARSVTAYLNDMRSIADELALAQCPVSDEDIVVYVLTQLGDEYKSIMSVVRIRETPISLGELADILTDHERQLKEADDAHQSLMTSANITQRGSFGSRNQQPASIRRFRNNNNNGTANNRPNSPQGRTNRMGVVCKFCNFAGNETRVCRKLARFLKEHNVFPMQAASSYPSPTANSTIGSTSSWLFDTGASHHATPSVNPLQTFSEYTGPNEVRLGNDNSLQISHIGQSTIPTFASVLTLRNVLCVPKLQNNLVSISQLFKTNKVSVELFDSHFLVKELQTGTTQLRRTNINGVYYGPLSYEPTINTVRLSHAF
ncbi:PREDICTED: uncharacterized protein LOC109193237 [Ipomoea nil]|uniref:uncharacterized protein LOC109193237 n=1 Tax=Ipomoea nil TaxID=35883 RepID=UPI0009017883|nr:PREDICTED: uncharacterized protein LOC109193237 [Ipomoea nil]